MPKVSYLKFSRNIPVKLFALVLLFAFNTKKANSQAAANLLLLDSVYAYILTQGIKHPEIALKQVIVETGWLKSPFLMNKHNLFGFSTSTGYMNFPTWKSSVEYYKRWQKKYYTDNKEDYYLFLVRIKYASTITYINYLQNFKLPDKYCKKEIGLAK